MPRKKNVTPPPKKLVTKPELRRRDDTHPVVVEIRSATCPACGSPNREWFHAVKTMEFNGYRVIWRNTRCTDCGQRYKTKERVDVR